MREQPQRTAGDDGAAEKPETGPALRLLALTKRFSARRSLSDIVRLNGRALNTVVDRVTLDVHVGEVFGILGPNGAGKTTLFRILSTMIVPDEGTATIWGSDIRGDPAAVREMLAAVWSDERSLNWRLSAHENLRLFAALYRVPFQAVERRITAVLESVGLAFTGREMVASFSSGMRQRLLIARALLSRPRVLLLDEPTRGLDPISAREFRHFLREELIQRQRCTIVVASHNTDEALRFCDRLAVLDRGCVLATGTPSDLTSRFSGERYRVLTTDPEHYSFAQLQQLGLTRHLGLPRKTTDGWFEMECAISGGSEGSAEVLKQLHAAGACVARLERVEPSLADLISRIIESRAPEYAHA